MSETETNSFDIQDISSNGSGSGDTTICEEEKIIHTICETEECADVAIVDLEELCDIEGNKVFDGLKKFVNENNADNLRRDMQKLFVNCPKSLNNTNEESVKAYNKFENLLLLKTFKRLKLMEKECIEYKLEYEEYDTYHNLYANNSDKAEAVHEFNTTRIENRANETDDSDQFMKTILTQYKKDYELLTYELLFYRPKFKISLTKDNMKDVSNKICTNISRFNPLVKLLLEDHSWTVNTKDTLNFSVPKNRIVLSNSINTEDEENSTLTTHLDMLMQYIRRIYKVTSARYTIQSDNKYYFSWILITVGYSEH